MFSTAASAHIRAKDASFVDDGSAPSRSQCSSQATSRSRTKAAERSANAARAAGSAADDVSETAAVASARSARSRVAWTISAWPRDMLLPARGTGRDGAAATMQLVPAARGLAPTRSGGSAGEDRRVPAVPRVDVFRGWSRRPTHRIGAARPGAFAQHVGERRREGRRGVGGRGVGVQQTLEAVGVEGRLARRLVARDVEVRPDFFRRRRVRGRRGLRRRDAVLRRRDAVLRRDAVFIRGCGLVLRRDAVFIRGCGLDRARRVGGRADRDRQRAEPR